MQTFLKRNKYNNASTKIPQFGGFFIDNCFLYASITAQTKVYYE